MSERNYFLPGEYIGDMHYGVTHSVNKIRDRTGEACLESMTQFEIHSEKQREGLEAFLNATRSLYSDDGYLNKMLVAVDERTGAYMYDGRYFGIVTF